MSEKKLFLLDAMALIYRAYYALIRVPRVTSTGRNTNAQFGFTTTLIDLINKEKPSHLAVVFDTHAPTERHIDFAEYKANRQEAPEDIISSLSDIKRIVNGFSLPCMEKDGYEADDVIGALAHEAADLGYTVYMVTPDKDYGQLVRDNIFIYKPSYQGGGVEVLGPKEVCEKWNIKRVDQVVDILGLMGDAVDNIPGIPGVGEKTAAKLLAEYDTLENVLEHADKIKGALGEKVRNGRDLAIMSKKLATIITNVPVSFHEEDFRVKEWNREALNEIFTELEFKALGKRLLGDEYNVFDKAAAPVSMDLFGNPLPQKQQPVVAAAVVKETVVAEVIEELPTNVATIETTPHEYILVNSKAEIDALVQQLMLQKEIAFDTETTGTDANQADLVGFSFCWEKAKGYYVAVPTVKEEVIDILNHFKPLFDREDIVWVGQNIKYDLIMLKWYGFEIRGALYDTMLANYVFDPDGKRSMDALAVKYLGYEPVSIETLIGKKGKNQLNMRDVPVEQVAEYAAEDADITLQLKHAFEPLLDKESVRDVFEKVENKLVPVLVDIEYEGVGVDVKFLQDYSKQLEVEIREAEQNVYKHAGVNFNLGSPKQLGEVLFDLMKLDSGAKKTKTGQYATGEDVLAKLRNKHQIIDDILVYRELTKLKSTYIDALPQLINPRTGRVHTSFNQTVAVTGRLSSNNPNLQNIPIRTDRGREIRKAFIARAENWSLISADYSQIELRIVAAISGDESMIQAFVDGKDIHTATAAKVYSVAESDVTFEQRRNAKAVNFGIIYGQSAFGLAENLGISRSEAKSIIDNYFTQYPAIKKYMDGSIHFAKEHTYVQTLMGRKRWLRDIHSANQTVRGYAERNAINMPIQGTAADMIKLAMIDVHKELKKKNLRTRMILQVHDELVFDVPNEELDEVRDLVKKGMEGAMALPNHVPVNAETGSGSNWLEAH
ncbi:DNA polymerase I [Taibaiella soli]|uniref:DNA polymerase I n=1 Tax=Taibaiella soli TaxID=1649169 RepID=A0A2W2AKV2_9BACT|nr:DNA polymerase I [Taibaiella soli]PZF72910.1 DNA polymerase I [Taibaiella soli]